jgi:transcriptional regulator with PAS, ATPase and Fis domain
MNSNQSSGKMKLKSKKHRSDKQMLQTPTEVFDNILGSIREPLVVLDSDLKVVKANHSFYRMFDVKPDETEGILIYNLGNRQWNIPKLKELLEDILPENSLFHDFEVEHTFETIGQSDGLKYVLYKVEQIAGSNANVLVLGETGTGKELVARAIHGLSMRKNRALVKVNCATLPSNLIESELFGHEKGAFTGSHARHLGRFEVADGTAPFFR